MGDIGLVSIWMYGVFNTSLQGLWLHLATTKIFAWPHATLVFAGTPKDMLPQTQSARERRTPSSAEYTDWLICPRTTGYVVHGEHQVANLPADDVPHRPRAALIIRDRWYGLVATQYGVRTNT